MHKKISKNKKSQSGLIVTILSVIIITSGIIVVSNSTAINSSITGSAIFDNPQENIIEKTSNIEVWASTPLDIKVEQNTIDTLLTLDNKTALPEQEIYFYLNDSFLESKITNSKGHAELNFNPYNISLGIYSFKAEFQGNPSLYLNPSFVEKQIEIVEQNGTLQIIRIKLNETLLDVSLNETNLTLLNQINQTINVTSNLTIIEIETIQGQAEINKPVNWTKKIEVKNPNDIELKNKEIEIELSEYSKNIGIRDLTNSENEQEETTEEKGLFTAQLTQNNNKNNSKKTKWTEREIPSNSSIIYEIKYETPAPNKTEEDLKNGKRVYVSSPEGIYYENVLSFTNLSESLNIINPSQVKIRWVEEGNNIPIKSIQDKDNNGIYDYVSWIAPHLSNQTFDIIVITKAEHLDSNKTFISDIYNEIKELDGIWSETIPNQHYVRITFERELDYTKDITIFPRKVSGSPTVKVYEAGSDSVIAEFAPITSNEYNTVYLTNLQGLQNIFDLRILDGSVEFDHIIDPPGKADQFYSGNLTCEEFEDVGVNWGAVGTKSAEKYTYYNWSIGTDSPGQKNKDIVSIYTYARYISAGGKDPIGSPEGYYCYAKIANSTEGSPPADWAGIRYAAYLNESVASGDTLGPRWECGEGGTPTTCDVTGGGFNNASHNYSVQIYSHGGSVNHFGITDVFNVKYTWCWTPLIVKVNVCS